MRMSLTDTRHANIFRIHAAGKVSGSVHESVSFGSKPTPLPNPTLQDFIPDPDVQSTAAFKSGDRLPNELWVDGAHGKGCCRTPWAQQPLLAFGLQGRGFRRYGSVFSCGMSDDRCLVNRRRKHRPLTVALHPVQLHSREYPTSCQAQRARKHQAALVLVVCA